jgi:anaerobic selenocysteine-containing dehydrogenase
MAADKAVCISDNGEITVTIELDENLRQGMVTLPHGYGMRYANSQPIGPEINQLTSSGHTDPWAKTPLHKHVPVAIRKLVASA